MAFLIFGGGGGRLSVCLKGSGGMPRPRKFTIFRGGGAKLGLGGPITLLVAP